MTLPDAEAVLIKYLKGHTAVTAEVSGRVYTRLPTVKTFPLVRVTMLGAPPQGPPLVYSTPLFQFDIWGPLKPAARRAAEAVQAAVADIHEATHTGGEVTWAETGGLTPSDDDTFEPLKYRYTFTATISLH